jgi:hypothetical protein
MNTAKITFKKKSKIELAREIIAGLRRDMQRPAKPTELRLSEAEPFMPVAMAVSRPTRPHRPRPLETSHF